MPSTGFIWMGSSGCLLPMLIIFNLFFGRVIFNSTRLWLGIEAVLILIFILKINALAARISQQFKPQGRVIDVAGEVVEEKQKVKEN